MIIAYTKNDSLKDIRNKVAISELEGKAVNMGSIFDNIADRAAAKAVISAANSFYRSGGTPDSVIKGIADGLKKSPEEAEEIFKNEILMAEATDLA